jgi:hypothetical protein
MLVVVLVLVLVQKYLLLELVIFNKISIACNLYIFKGPIGLVSMLAAKAMGADSIIMTGEIFI